MVKFMSSGAIERKKQRKPLSAKQKQGIVMFIIISPLLFTVFLFSYYPLHGWLYALYDYRPPHQLFNTPFVGLQWFQILFSNAGRREQIFGVLTNTFAMSGLGILFSWLPMAFAILLSEINCRPYKRMVQTLTTLPNFISWVLVYSMAFFMFNSTGIVNNILIQLGILSKPFLFLQQENNVWITMWLWNTWKGLGWSAIIYIAALSGLDQELYEAAYVDGAGRFQVIFHIIIPGLLPTYFVLLLLNIANFLNNGFEQYFLFGNPFNMERIQVLDLFVYNLGLGQGSYSLATAISIMKSIVSITLLFTVNFMSKFMRGESII